MRDTCFGGVAVVSDQTCTNHVVLVGTEPDAPEYDATRTAFDGPHGVRSLPIRRLTEDGSVLRTQRAETGNAAPGQSQGGVCDWRGIILAYSHSIVAQGFGVSS